MNELFVRQSFLQRMVAFLGICGCVSCYVAMFPAMLLGIVGTVGISSSTSIPLLNAYMDSVLFQPILILSIFFLIAGLLPSGARPIIVAVLGGLGVFVSMNVYMSEWLFTMSFSLISLAYFLAFRKTKAPQLQFAIVLLLAIVTLGVMDIVRSVFSAPPPHIPADVQQQRIDNRTMDIMNL